MNTQLKLGLGADMSQICLIDAKNFLYRNHYTHRDLRGPDGEPTSVLYGCLNGLLSLNKRLPDTPLVLVWDGGGTTWRHRYLSNHKRADPIQPTKGTDWVGKQVANSINFVKQSIAMPAVTRTQAANATFKEAYGMAPKKPVDKPVGYKAHRVSASQDDDKAIAVSQIPELKRITRLLGIKNFRIHGLEGDDLLGIMATAILNRKMFDQVIIHSSDTDFYQLLGDRRLKVLKGVGQDGNLIWVNQADVLAEYHVTADEWTKYRAITGDVSDNIPHLLHNVGPVRAVRLLRAGVDASLPREKVGQMAINALNDMTKGTLNIEDFWPRLRKNYRACQLLTNHEFIAPMMEQEVVDKIVKMLALLHKDFLMRDEEGRTEESYRAFCEWCIQRGMGDLRRRAGEFADFV